MPLSDADKRAIYDRAGGRCECSRQHEREDAPHHGGRCANTFTFASGSGLTAWWDANYIQAEEAGGASTLENAEALCGVCYQLAHSVARG